MEITSLSKTACHFAVGYFGMIILFPLAVTKRTDFYQQLATMLSGVTLSSLLLATPAAVIGGLFIHNIREIIQTRVLRIPLIPKTMLSQDVVVKVNKEVGNIISGRYKQLQSRDAFDLWFPWFYYRDKQLSDLVWTLCFFLDTALVLLIAESILVARFVANISPQLDYWIAYAYAFLTLLWGAIILQLMIRLGNLVILKAGSLKDISLSTILASECKNSD